MAQQRLCSICSLIIEWQQAPERKVGDGCDWPYHSSQDSFKASARDCPLCAYMVDKLSLEFSKTRYNIHLTKLSGGVSNVWWDELDVHNIFGCPMFQGMMLRLVTNMEPAGRRAIWQIQHPTFEDRFPVIKEWLKDCERHHGQCRETNSWMPRRLLRIKPTLTSPLCQIIQTQDLPAPAIYATLSHCWGDISSQPPLRTVKGNLDDHYIDVPWDNLPRNFQDAALVTLKLDLQYLWIDSLCIIQDDKEDWQEQAAQMAQIYQNGALNIAASSALDSHAGFLHNGIHADVQKVNLPAPSVGGYVLVTSKMTHTLSNWECATKNRYNSRGWVLQEIGLSPRTVFFDGDQLRWQCRQRCTAEDWTYDKDHIQCFSNGLGGPLFDFSTAMSAHKMWWQWIKDFSRRELTYAEDRAPALAGLSSFYAHKTGHKPLLGLWSDTLAYDLSWEHSWWSRTVVKAQTTRPSTEFPTWSWLSLMGRTRAQLMTPDPEASTTSLRIVDAHVEWNSHAWTSGLKSSLLIVNGMVKPVILERGTKASHAIGQLGDVLLLHSETHYSDRKYKDRKFNDRKYKDREYKDPVSLQPVQGKYSLDFDEPEILGGPTLAVLALHLYQDVNEGIGPEPAMFKLLSSGRPPKSRRVEDKCLLLVEKGGLYRRVGTAELEFQHTFAEKDIGRKYIERHFVESQRLTVEIC